VASTQRVSRRVNGVELATGRMLLPYLFAYLSAAKTQRPASIRRRPYAL
jgi:hypothetical protein